MGNEIQLATSPNRIISLVPSQTELLIELGLASRIVGRTKFCIHPKEITDNIPIIGGTKNPRIQDIIKLNPDLIIGNKEENDKQSIEIMKQYFPVWMSDISNLQDSYGMIQSLGEITGKQSEANELICEIKFEYQVFYDFVHSGAAQQNISCLYLIWQNPFMVAGGNTFIHEMISVCGLKNLASNFSRYPELSAQQISELGPDFIFLSSEPYPFSNKNVSEISKLFPQSKVILVDGEMFSWYGSRLKMAFPYFKKLIQSI